MFPAKLRRLLRSPPRLRTENRVVQSLWIGERLSTMEQLAIRSFLQNGHEFHLYTYGAVRNVPGGTIVRDANEIMPEARVFRYGPAAGKGQGSFAGFANFFRYKLLRERGGYWVDADVVCLRPFDFPQPYVFALESRWHDRPPGPANAVIKSPAASAFAQRCCQVCDCKDPAQLAWGETGPRLAEQIIAELSLQEFLQPASAFCAVPWYEPHKLIEPGGRIEDHWHALHLSQEIWRRRNWDKDSKYPASSMYEQLKARYL
jgi:hypothetical protein